MVGANVLTCAGACHHDAISEGGEKRAESLYRHEKRAFQFNAYTDSRCSVLFVLRDRLSCCTLRGLRGGAFVVDSAVRCLVLIEIVLSDCRGQVALELDPSNESALCNLTLLVARMQGPSQTRLFEATQRMPRQA
eukprot:3086250-Rhodomonas_salina.3